MADHFRGDHRISVAAEPFDAPDSRALREEVEADMIDRYDGDPAEGVKPNHFDVAAYLVARDEAGEAVAGAALRPLEGEVAEIKRMYVRPAARGRGIARLLLAALENEARSRGFRSIRLETGLRQPEAMALYTSAGYREIPGFGAYADSPLSRSFERLL